MRGAGLALVQAAAGGRGPVGGRGRWRSVGGTAAIIALQAKANADLRAANSRVAQRYELAVDAIKTFHTGVSEDFLLKQEQFKELRDRLLRSAADFYGKLGALLGQETDVGLAAGAGGLELRAGRPDRQGRPPRGRAGGAPGSAGGAGGAGGRARGRRRAKADVGRSLTAVAFLLEATGKADEAVAAYRRSESLLAGPAGSDPAARAALAVCRSWLGWFLSNTGQTADALAAYQRARADQEALAAAPGATNDVRRDLAGTVNRIGALLLQTGKPAEAEAEYRRAIATHQKLADDHSAVIVFRTGLARSHSNLGCAAVADRQAGRGGGRVPHGAGDLPEAGRRQPKDPRLSQRDCEYGEQPFRRPPPPRPSGRGPRPL